MASLSNINGIFDVHSTGAIQFNGNHGASGQILKSNGNAAPTWIPQSDIVGAYLPLAGGTLTGATATANGISFTVGGTLSASNFSGSSSGTNTGDQTSVTGASGYLDTNRGTPSSAAQYWQAYNLGTTEAPSTDWYTTLRFGHGNPTTYYGNTLAIKMTGTGVGDIYTQNLQNGTFQGWKKYWNDGNFNPASYLPLSGGTLTGALTGTTATFSGLVSGITPTAAANFATKAYVDAHPGSGGTVTSVATGNGLTGGTITTTGTLSLDRPNSQLGAVLATYGTTAGASGRIRCTAPFNTNTGKMFSIEITLYGSYTQHNYVVSAYMYSTTNQWYSPKAIYTTTGTATPDIIVGRDANGKAYISIANANYTGVLVHNMTRGYQTSLADTYDPWTIAVNAGTENSVGVSTSQVWTTANHTPGNYLPLSGGTLTGALTGTSATFSGFTTSATGFGINYVSGGTVPMVILANATTYGIFYREASPDHIEFKHGGTVRQSFDGNGNVSITGDFTVSGGDITLGGTGRIQGVDTVTDSTDAANKAYVDAHPGSGGTVTSVATGSGLTGGTITSTGTLSVDSTVIRTTGNQSITGNTTFYPSSTSTGYSTAAIELMASSSGTSGTPPRISWHWGGVVASSITIEANGTIAVRNNPGNAYEQFKASVITATSNFSGNLTGNVTGNVTGSSGSCTGNSATATLATTATMANAVANTGYGGGTSFTFYQSSGSFSGYSGWHNYYIGNHGNGSNYYNTIIAIPFWGSPRYSRLEGGVQRGPFEFWTSERTIVSTHDVTAPRYYDTNTTYYGDFASTSNINALTLVGTLSGQNGYFLQDVGIGFNSGAIGGKLNIQINSANGIGIKNNLNGKSGAQGLLQYTSASYASGGYNMVFQAVPPSGSDTNMLLCYLNGNIVNRFNSYGQYSDRKLKENIVDTTPKLEDVKKIRIRNFNFKDDPYKQIGVIAQEFEEVFPGLVEDKEVPDQDETTKTVKYSVLVPILVKAIQELEARVKELENK